MWSVDWEIYNVSNVCTFMIIFIIYLFICLSLNIITVWFISSID